MSNKPKIKATCAAGCLWETVHMEDFLKAANTIAVNPQSNGTYALQFRKTYRIKRGLEGENGEWGVDLRLVNDGTLNGIDHLLDPPEADKYADYFTFRFLAITTATDGKNYALLEYNGVRETQEITVGSDFGKVLSYYVELSGTDECYLVNEDGIVQAHDGDSVFIRYASNPVGTDASETWSTGKKYIGIYVGQEAPKTQGAYQWMKFIGEGGDGSVDTSDLEARIEALENQLYEAISITSLSTSPAYFEKGSTVNAITLNWKTNKTPTALNLTCSMPLRETELNRDDTSAYIDYIAASISNPVTFQLSATDEKGATATKSVAVAYCNGVYYGVAAEPTTYDSAFVLGLAKELRANKKPSFTANAGAGQYIYYCLPVSMGACTFAVGGFTGGFTLVDTIAFTNASGYTENYYIYRSDNANLGATSVTVS